MTYVSICQIKKGLSHRDSLFLSFKFVVFSLQQMVKNLKSSSTNYKLRTTNYKVNGAPGMMAETFLCLTSRFPAR